MWWSWTLSQAPLHTVTASVAYGHSLRYIRLYLNTCYDTDTDTDTDACYDTCLTRALPGEVQLLPRERDHWYVDSRRRSEA